MTFKPYHQQQTLLLPPSYEDVLGEDHDAVILRELMERLDTTALERSYRNADGGRAAYHPVMILSVLIYAYMQGIFSSRKIAQRLRQDLACMYLAGNTTPDFRTLARFRKEKGTYIASLFLDVVAQAHMLGLVSFGTCSIDGTKFYANASKTRNTTRTELEETIHRCIAEADALDAREDARYGDDEDDRDACLKTKAGREQKRQELRAQQRVAEARLQRRGSYHAPVRVNTTDPDSRLMPMKRGDYAQGYNAQSIVERGFILTATIGNSAADQATLIPAVRTLQREHQTPRRLLADKGFSTEDNYTFCEEQGIDAYIPIATEQVDLSKYTYDKGRDTYTDQAGRVFVLNQYVDKRDGTGRRGVRSSPTATRAEKQRNYRTVRYMHIDPATRKKHYLSIAYTWQRHVRKQKKKFATVLGKQRYKQRMHDVEGVFANIKKNIGFTTFSLRGLAGVAAEWTLVALVHNLKKLMMAAV